jgi:hypothetical protein
MCLIFSSPALKLSSFSSSSFREGQEECWSS